MMTQSTLRNKKDYWPSHIDLPVNDWLFTIEQIQNSPSRVLKNMSESDEEARYAEVAALLLDIKKTKLKALPNVVLFFAMIFVRRYFQFVEIDHNPANHILSKKSHLTVGLTCFFLAARVLEIHIKLDDLVQAAIEVIRNMMHKNRGFSGRDLIQLWAWKDAVLEAELAIMDTLCFDFLLFNPYEQMSSLLRPNEDDQNDIFWDFDRFKSLVQGRFEKVSGTPIFLVYTVENVFKTIMVLVAMLQKMKFPINFFKSRNLEIDPDYVLKMVHDFKNFGSSSIEFTDFTIEKVKATLREGDHYDPSETDRTLVSRKLFKEQPYAIEESHSHDSQGHGTYSERHQVDSNEPQYFPDAEPNQQYRHQQQQQQIYGNSETPYRDGEHQNGVFSRSRPNISPTAHTLSDKMRKIKDDQLSTPKFTPAHRTEEVDQQSNDKKSLPSSKIDSTKENLDSKDGQPKSQLGFLPIPSNSYLTQVGSGPKPPSLSPQMRSVSSIPPTQFISKPSSPKSGAARNFLSKYAQPQRRQSPLPVSETTKDKVDTHKTTSSLSKVPLINPGVERIKPKSTRASPETKHENFNNFEEYAEPESETGVPSTAVSVIKSKSKEKVANPLRTRASASKANALKTGIKPVSKGLGRTQLPAMISKPKEVSSEVVTRLKRRSQSEESIQVTPKTKRQRSRKYQSDAIQSEGSLSQVSKEKLDNLLLEIEIFSDLSDVE